MTNVIGGGVVVRYDQALGRLSTTRPVGRYWVPHLPVVYVKAD